MVLMARGNDDWLDIDREEADDFVRKRVVHTDDALIGYSFNEKMRSKHVSWEHKEKASQFAISVTGSARAGHGHFSGRPIPDLTIGETFASLYGSKPHLKMFEDAPDEQEAIENVRMMRQRHVDWFIEHFEMVTQTAPDIVEYQVPGKRKSIFGLTTHKVLTHRSNETPHHPHITSTLDQFVIAAKLFTDMDRYEHRRAVQTRFRNTLADRRFDIGGGDCYLVHVPTMRRHEHTLSLLEQGERGPSDVSALAQRGIIVNHDDTPDAVRRSTAGVGDEWSYVRAKSGPGSSDGLAFTFAGYLGGWGLAAAGRHIDNLDTWIKWSQEYEHGELDSLILDMLENGHSRVGEILERYNAEELSQVFAYMIAQDNSPNGEIFRQSTGMVPNYRRFHDKGVANGVLDPLTGAVEREFGPGYESHYQLHLPTTAENLAAVGQSLPSNFDMPTDWKFVSSHAVGREFASRIMAVREDGFPAPVDPQVASWITGDMRLVIGHGTYLDRPVVSRHTMPFDLTPLGGSYR